MANVVKLKRGSGSDPSASDMVVGEPVIRTDTAELFFKKDDGSVAKVSGGGGGPDFKYLALRNAANNGAASYPNADFTLVTSGTTNAITVAAANTLLVSVNGVIQKPNTGTSTPSSGFALSGTTIKFGGNISAAPDFILYQESGGIGEPSDETVSEAKLQVSNSPVNGYFLSAQSGNTGGLTWAAPVATSCTGNSATATALATARAINGVNFDGTAAITVTAAAGTLSGNTLNSSVVTSSLTSLGDLAGLTVDGDMTLTGANYNVLWDKSDNALEFADNAKAKFGTGNDLEIYHSGSHSYIQNTTNFLFIHSNSLALRSQSQETFIDCSLNGSVDLYYDNSKKFETTSVGAKVTGDLSVQSANHSNFKVLSGNSDVIGFFQTVQGAELRVGTETNNAFKLFVNGVDRVHLDTSGNVNIPNDSGKFQAGASQDLQIFHDGTNSIIDDAGVGALSIRSDTGINILKRTGDEFMIKGVPDGAVELYFNNAKKAETVTGGFTITGTCTATSFAGDGSSLTGISAGATGGGSDEVFYENSTTVTTSYSITSNKNAMSAGPISVNSGAVVTIPSGSVWTIV